LAEVYDHHLSETNPLWVRAGPTEPPGPLQVHVHRAMDVDIVVSGEMELQYGDYHLLARRGDVCLGAMWEPHAWRTIEPGTSNVAFTFLPQALDVGPVDDLRLLRLFMVPAKQRPRVTTEKLRQEVLATAEEVAREYGEQRPGWRGMARLGLLRVLATLGRGWSPPRGRRASSRANPSDLARLTPALSLARSSLEAEANPRQAAAACGFSVSWFHWLFRETMGITYGRFCMRLRLAAAAGHLLASEASVQDIADRLGFVDASHLHRHFRAQYGCTPAEYRLRARGDRRGPVGAA